MVFKPTADDREQLLALARSFPGGISIARLAQHAFAESIGIHSDDDLRSMAFGHYKTWIKRELRAAHEANGIPMFQPLGRQKGAAWKQLRLFAREEWHGLLAMHYAQLGEHSHRVALLVAAYEEQFGEPAPSEEDLIERPDAETDPPHDAW